VGRTVFPGREESAGVLGTQPLCKRKPDAETGIETVRMSGSAEQEQPILLTVPALARLACSAQSDCRGCLPEAHCNLEVAAQERTCTDAGRHLTSEIIRHRLLKCVKRLEALGYRVTAPEAIGAAQIRILYRAGLSKSDIARRVQVGRALRGASRRVSPPRHRAATVPYAPSPKGNTRAKPAKGVGNIRYSMRLRCRSLGRDPGNGPRLPTNPLTSRLPWS